MARGALAPWQHVEAEQVGTRTRVRTRRLSAVNRGRVLQRWNRSSAPRPQQSGREKLKLFAPRVFILKKNFCERQPSQMDVLVGLESGLELYQKSKRRILFPCEGV